MIVPIESSWLQPTSESILHLFILFVDACSSSVQGKLAQLLDMTVSKRLRVQKETPNPFRERTTPKRKLFGEDRDAWPTSGSLFKGKIPRVIRPIFFDRLIDG